MYKYILWDNDGVLVDTEQWYFKATQRALGELDIQLELSLYLEYMAEGRSCWDMALAAGIDQQVVVQQRQQRDDCYQDLLTKEDTAIPGVEQALQILAASYRMAVVTTSLRAPFELIHGKRNILPFMEFALTREDYKNSKPDPEPYLMALDRFGAQPHEAVIIEDSQRGLRAAIAAGIDCLVVYNSFTASHDFTGATYRAHTLSEVPAILAG